MVLVLGGPPALVSAAAAVLREVAALTLPNLATACCLLLPSTILTISFVLLDMILATKIYTVHVRSSFHTT